MEVKVYTTPSCSWCRRLKEYLQKNNVAFTEISVAGNQKAAQEMIGKSGQMGIPVTDVDGTIIVGYDEEALGKALRRQ
ncbi:MAG: glutaredoxin domain-containing protein [Candidatus Altiarchaeota archaeon]